MLLLLLLLSLIFIIIIIIILFNVLTLKFCREVWSSVLERDFWGKIQYAFREGTKAG